VSPRRRLPWLSRRTSRALDAFLGISEFELATRSGQKTAGGGGLKCNFPASQVFTLGPRLAGGFPRDSLLWTEFGLNLGPLVQHFRKLMAADLIFSASTTCLGTAGRIRRPMGRKAGFAGWRSSCTSAAASWAWLAALAAIPAGLERRSRESWRGPVAGGVDPRGDAWHSVQVQTVGPDTGAAIRKPCPGPAAGGKPGRFHVSDLGKPSWLAC
jgi:hypothetical protein